MSEDAKVLGKEQTLPASPESLPPQLRSPSGGADYKDLIVVDRAHYHFAGELARGGMGRILEARDRRLGRSVAIKEVIHADETSIARFEREVRITAKLQHPGIVHVHEAGRWPSGQPFYVMKLIRGKPLDARIAEARTLADRLELLPSVIAVVDALAFAHDQQVIHRDLKPGNVLVGKFGETVVIDWGIAKDLASLEADDIAVGPYRKATPPETTPQTIEGSVIGTPAYMPPEQAEGRAVDARADVYSLGALLYQVLTGRPPYRGATTADVLNQVIDDAPDPIVEHAPDAPEDLVAIVEKAMARDPAARFPTADAMATELKRFQQGQLVASRRYTRWELVRRWVSRYRAPVAVGAIAFVTLAVLATLGIRQILAEQGRTHEQELEAFYRGDVTALELATRALEHDPTDAIAQLKKLSPGSQHWRSARTLAADALARGVAHVLDAGAPINALAISPNERLLASHDQSGALRVWSLETWSGRVVGHAAPLAALAMPDEETVLGLTYEGTIVRWRLHEHAPATIEIVYTRPVQVREAIFDRTGRRVLLVSHRGREPDWTPIRAAVIDVDTNVRHEIGEFENGAWSPDGTFLILSHTYLVFRHDLATGVTTPLPGEFGQIQGLATDGRRIWVAHHRDDTLVTEIVDKTRTPIYGDVREILPLPSGAFAAAATHRVGSLHTETLAGSHHGIWRSVQRRSVNAGDLTPIIAEAWFTRMRLRGHEAHVTDIAVGREGVIVSGDGRGEIRVWRDSSAMRLFHGGTTASVAHVTRDGRELVVGRLGPALDVRELATGKVRRLEVTALPPGYKRRDPELVMRVVEFNTRNMLEKVAGPDAEIVSLVASRDGRRIATIDGETQLVFWDLDRGTGRILARDVVHVAINADGTQLLTSRATVPKGDKRVIERWDPTTGVATRTGEGTATAFAYADDGTFALATTNSATAVVTPDTKLIDLSRSTEIHRSLALTRDGKTLLAGGDGWTLDIWDVPSGAFRSIAGHTGTITRVLLSPDETLVATTAGDNTVRIIRLADGETLEILEGHTDLVTMMHFVDNQTFLTASDDGTARLWDLETDRYRVFAGHEARLVFAAKVGHEVITVDHAHQIARHPDSLPTDEMLLRVALDAATNK